MGKKCARKSLSLWACTCKRGSNVHRLFGHAVRQEAAVRRNERRVGEDADHKRRERLDAPRVVEDSAAQRAQPQAELVAAAELLLEVLRRAQRFELTLDHDSDPRAPVKKKSRCSEVASTPVVRV